MTPHGSLSALLRCPICCRSKLSSRLHRVLPWPLTPRYLSLLNDIRVFIKWQAPNSKYLNRRKSLRCAKIGISEAREFGARVGGGCFASGNRFPKRLSSVLISGRIYSFRSFAIEARSFSIFQCALRRASPVCKRRGRENPCPRARTEFRAPR
jgi:hypothetical protein